MRPAATRSSIVTGGGGNEPTDKTEKTKRASDDNRSWQKQEELADSRDASENKARRERCTRECKKIRVLFLNRFQKINNNSTVQLITLHTTNIFDAFK